MCAGMAIVLYTFWRAQAAFRVGTITPRLGTQTKPSSCSR